EAIPRFGDRRILAVEGCVGWNYHVPRFFYRISQRVVGLSTRPAVAAVLKANRLVRIDEEDVVDDQLRVCARKVIDETRMHHARPRPATGEWLQRAQRSLVDLDECDVRAGVLGSRSVRKAPVVCLELEGQQRIDAGPS